MTNTSDASSDAEPLAYSKEIGVDPVMRILSAVQDPEVAAMAIAAATNSSHHASSISAERSSGGMTTAKSSSRHHHHHHHHSVHQQSLSRPSSHGNSSSLSHTWRAQQPIDVFDAGRSRIINDFTG